MNKLVLLICCIAVPSVMSACAGSSLATDYGLTFKSDAAVPTKTITYCKDLVSASKVCCEEDSINTFQTKVTTIVTTLNGLVKTRDENLLAARKAVVQANQTLTQLQAAFELAKTNLTAMVTANVADASTVQSFAADFKTWFNAVLMNYDTIKSGFDTYQTKRQTCFNELIADQAAAWCAVCDQDPSTQGFSSGAFTYSTDLQTRLQANCYDYITNAATQNQILRLYAYRNAYADMMTALVDIAANKNSGVAAFKTAMGKRESTPTAVQLPASCTGNTACAWIYSTLFNNGKLDQTILVNGGTTATTRLLFQKPRNLQTGWKPDTDEAKVNVGFEANPGKVQNTDDRNSAFRVGVVSSIIAAFVALLF